MTGIIGIILFVIVFPRIIKLLDKAVDILIVYARRHRELSRLTQGLITIEDLHFLTPVEFEEWCGEFLERLGYSDYLIKPGTDGEKSICCSNGSNTVYVKCKRYAPDVFSPYKVGIGAAEELAGMMLHDDVHEGIIITTGSIRREVLDYIKALPSGYKIAVFDGDTLIEKANEVYGAKIAPEEAQTE